MRTLELRVVTLIALLTLRLCRVQQQVCNQCPPRIRLPRSAPPTESQSFGHYCSLIECHIITRSPVRRCHGATDANRIIYITNSHRLFYSALLSPHTHCFPCCAPSLHVSTTHVAFSRLPVTPNRCICVPPFILNRSLSHEPVPLCRCRKLAKTLRSTLENQTRFCSPHIRHTANANSA